METTIQQATLADVPQLAEMNRMLIEDEGSVNPMSLALLTERMQRWIASGEYHAVLIYRNDEVVGYVLYREERSDFDVDQLNIFVRQFFIKRTYRRRGIGQGAFEQVTQTHFPPYATLILEVLSTNLQGRAFWERLGFVPYFTTYRRAAQNTQG